MCLRAGAHAAASGGGTARSCWPSESAHSGAPAAPGAARHAPTRPQAPRAITPPTIIPAPALLARPGPSACFPVHARKVEGRGRVGGRGVGGRSPRAGHGAGKGGVGGQGRCGGWGGSSVGATPAPTALPSPPSPPQPAQPGRCRRCPLPILARRRPTRLQVMCRTAHTAQPAKRHQRIPLAHRAQRLAGGQPLVDALQMEAAGMGQRGVRSWWEGRRLGAALGPPA